jgi:hypothetical protein
LDFVTVATQAVLGKHAGRTYQVDYFLVAIFFLLSTLYVVSRPWCASPIFTLVNSYVFKSLWILLWVVDVMAGCLDWRSGGAAQWRNGAGPDGMSMCVSLRTTERIGEAVNHRQAFMLRARIVHVFWVRKLRSVGLRRRQPIAAGFAALLAHNDLAGQSG